MASPKVSVAAVAAALAIAATGTAAQPSTGAQAKCKVPAFHLTAGHLPSKSPGRIYECRRAKKLSASDRRYYNRQFAKVHLAAQVIDVLWKLGDTHVIQWYNGVHLGTCQYFDAGYVLCTARGKVVGKGREG